MDNTRQELRYWGGSVNVTASANKDTSSVAGRYGSIMIKTASGLTKEVSVDQDAPEMYSVRGKVSLINNSRFHSGTLDFIFQVTTRTTSVASVIFKWFEFSVNLSASSVNINTSYVLAEDMGSGIVDTIICQTIGAGNMGVNIELRSSNLTLTGAKTSSAGEILLNITPNPLNPNLFQNFNFSVGSILIND